MWAEELFSLTVIWEQPWKEEKSRGYEPEEPHLQETTTNVKTAVVEPHKLAVSPQLMNIFNYNIPPNILGRFMLRAFNQADERGPTPGQCGNLLLQQSLKGFKEL